MGYTTEAAVSGLRMVLEVVCVCSGGGSFPLIPFTPSNTPIVRGQKNVSSGAGRGIGKT